MQATQTVIEESAVAEFSASFSGTVMSPGEAGLRRGPGDLQRHVRPATCPDRPLQRCRGRDRGGRAGPRERPRGRGSRRGPQRPGLLHLRRRDRDRPLRMKGVFVDPDARTARAAGGVTWGEFDRETQAFGLATTGGRITTTGIAGLTLGSGSGWTERTSALRSTTCFRHRWSPRMGAWSPPARATTPSFSGGCGAEAGISVS